jgi:ABC-2 type transport system ATP-binding protein
MSEQTQSSQPIIELRNVTKKIGKKTIIDQLNFDVPRGEVFGFLGPNGAGKTTTIRMMVGLMSITKGQILINGLDITENFERAIRHVGAIVENPEMYKYLTGFQNLLHYSRMIPGINRNRIDEVIKLVGLEKHIKDKVKTYSLGMRQRLGVAQALLHKPSLIILDEPTNGLDPAGIRELRDYLRNLTQEEGISVVVSSHLLSEMELMCDRVAIIQNGKLVDIRLVKDLVSKDDQVSVMFEVDQKEKALQVLAEMEGKFKVATHPEGVEVWINRAQIPIINAQLVRAEIVVYGINIVKMSLEDKFLEMTGSDQIA